MYTDRERKFIKQMCDEMEEEKRQIKMNPLSQYSTTQLKEELRRRKAEK